MKPRAQHGATLIELVIAITIITAAAGTIVGMLTAMSRSSADSMMQSQSASIANAYLKEILARSFANPAITANRINADSVFDYPACLPDLRVRDRFGNAPANLQSYQVAVNVGPPPAALRLPGIPLPQQILVTVTVTSPLNERTVLRGYKTNHP